jgi:uncharacterized protein YbaP (TraB family)
MARRLSGLTRARCGRAASIALASALLLAALTPVTVVAKDRHILWAVAGRHNTVYLLGSIHVLRAEDASLPPVATAAYDDAERLVMEIDLDDDAGDPLAMAATMRRMALLPEGRTLRDVLGADYAKIAAHAQRSGLDLAALDAFAPWFVTVTLLQLDLASRGYSAEFGVEQTIAREAAADRKPIQGLETPQQQFAILAGLPLALQKRFLMMTLEDTEQLDAELRDMLAAWKAGDTEKLARVLGDEFDDFPELYRPLTEDRNRAWVQQLVDLLDDDDDYLVVVGALHLVGPNSVVDLLRQRGFNVTQQ